MARDLVTAIIDLLNVQNDFLSVWVDHEVQQLNLDFDLGVMELDCRGNRIPHNQPLKTFLTNLPLTVPCEDPDACAFMEAEMAGMNQSFRRRPDGMRAPPPARVEQICSCRRRWSRGSNRPEIADERRQQRRRNGASAFPAADAELRREIAGKSRRG